MFDQLITSALNWKVEENTRRMNPPRKIGESGERRILRMAKAGYGVMEACEILGTYDYKTIDRVYKRHGFKWEKWRV